MQLATPYQEFIHASRYARWLPEQGHRESAWIDTVERYLSFMRERCAMDNDMYHELRESMGKLEVMPSMRCMMTAGEALRRDNVAGYNCCYVTLDKVERVSEIMYILMCGTGVGYSVEHQYVRQMPQVPKHLNMHGPRHVIADSRIGWAKACKKMFQNVFQHGVVPSMDYSRIRPAGARLKVFGGRCAGSKPLREFLEFSANMFYKAQGRRLSSQEWHDIVCKLADIVVVGGVRRSALISLSELDDDAMRKAKCGEWWMNQSYRALANNSAVYTERPSMDMFMDEMHSLYASKSGERGVFSRSACARQAKNVVPRWEDYTFECVATDGNDEAPPYAALCVHQEQGAHEPIELVSGATFAKAMHAGEKATFSYKQEGVEWWLRHYHLDHSVRVAHESTVESVRKQLLPRRRHQVRPAGTQ